MGQRYPKRTQQKYTRQRYRVRNWREYEAGLRKRGDLTLWFSEEAIAVWRKLHLVVDAGTGDVLTWAMTTHRVNATRPC